MANSTKKILRKEYDRLKKAFEKVIKPVKRQEMPQLVLQPYRNKKIF